MGRRARRLSIVSATILLALLLTACPPNGDAGVPPDDDEPPGAGPAIPLECEEAGYACTLGEISDEVMARSEALLEQLAERIEAGEAIADAAAWAREQEGMAEARVVAGGSMMYFLLEGGAPMYVGGDFDPPVSPEANSRFVNPPAGAAPTEPPDAPTPHGVVGRDTHRDDGTIRKNALILSPYNWQFGSNDSAPAIRTRLQNTRDYNDMWSGVPGSGIDVAINSSKTDFNVTVEDFLGWHKYDFIFISTHSIEGDCEGGLAFSVCETRISAGYTTIPCSTWRTRYPELTGLNCGKLTKFADETPIPSGMVIYAMFLSTDFFAGLYGPNPLEKTVVVLDSCESLKNDSIPFSIAGATSIFFGWDATVYASYSFRTTTTLVDHLLLGKPTKSAYAELVEAGLDGGIGYGPGLFGADFEKVGPRDGDELRLIDLPSARHPTSGMPLSAGTSVPFIGVADDGETDEYEFVVDVAGVVDPDATGGPGGPVGVAQVQNPADLYDVTLRVDGEELARENLGRPSRDATVERLDDITYRLTRVVELGFDVPAEGRNMVLEAELDPLPEGGRSFHEVEVALIPCGTFQATTSLAGFEEIEGDAFYDPPHYDPLADTVSIGLVDNANQVDLTFTREVPPDEIAPPFSEGVYPLSARPVFVEGVVDTVFASLGSYGNCRYDSCETITGDVTIDSTWTEERAGDTWHHVEGGFEFEIEPVPGQPHDGYLSAQGTFCAKGIEPEPGDASP